MTQSATNFKHWYFTDQEIDQDGARKWPAHLTFAQRRAILTHEITHGFPVPGTTRGGAFDKIPPTIEGHPMTREMSKRQFSAALKKYGLRKVLLWIDCPAKPGRSIGVTFNARTGKTAYRFTLARAIKEFDCEAQL